jgi:hypothetical protein
MLLRCYAEKHRDRYPWYAGVTVSDEWLFYSNFRRWMSSQEWKGLQLDKDLIGDGTIYSESTCLMVTPEVNSFMKEKDGGWGRHPVGVKLDPGGKYNARVTAGRRVISLGYFHTLDEARLAWIRGKAESAVELASRQSNPVVANALLAYASRLMEGEPINKVAEVSE